MRPKHFAVRVGLAAISALLLGGCDESAKIEAEAIAMTGGQPQRGREQIVGHGCGACHTIPGVFGANGLVGPPLTQIGSRAYIAGGLSNSPENMVRWLKDPPGVDPKTAMPNLHLSDRDARDIAGYLYTVR